MSAFKERKEGVSFSTLSGNTPSFTFPEKSCNFKHLSNSPTESTVLSGSFTLVRLLQSLNASGINCVTPLKLMEVTVRRLSVGKKSFASTEV